MNIFINDLCDVINHSNYHLFAYDLKVYLAIKLHSVYLLLQSGILYANGVQQIIRSVTLVKNRVICFSIKTKLFNYKYRLGNSFILRTDYIINIDSKLCFHQYVYSLFSHETELLKL
jgi:hypothetical protein